MAGFDGSLAHRAVRTETLLPYPMGRTALVDDAFTGKGVIHQQPFSRHIRQLSRVR